MTVALATPTIPPAYSGVFTVTDVFVDVNAKAWVGTAVIDDFDAENPYSTYEGHSYYLVGSDLVQFGTDLHAGTTEGAAVADEWDTDHATNGEIKFTSTNIYVTYMIKIDNKSTTNAVTVNLEEGFIKALAGTARTKAEYKIGATTTKIKDTVTPTAADLEENAYSARTSAETEFELAANTSVTFTIVRKLVDASKSFDAVAGNSLEGDLTIENVAL